MAVLYDDSERRLISEAKGLASTMAEILIVEEFAEDLMEAIQLNQEFVAGIAREQLNAFIKKRSHE